MVAQPGTAQIIITILIISESLELTSKRSTIELVPQGFPVQIRAMAFILYFQQHF